MTPEQEASIRDNAVIGVYLSAADGKMLIKALDAERERVCLLRSALAALKRCDLQDYGPCWCIRSGWELSPFHSKACSVAKAVIHGGA